MIDTVNYLEAIEAIEDRPTLRCAYRLAWESHDCIKMIGDAPKPFRRKTRINAGAQNDWGLYEPTDADTLANDWVVLEQCSR